MRLMLGPESFDPVFAAAKSRLFHLETRDDYNAANETEAFARWKEDESRDPRAGSFPKWAALVGEIVGRGVVMQRARIVTEPHTTYTRYLLALARYNVEAGEDVRYLPRHLADPLDSAGEDVWLIDDTAAAFSVFDDSDYWVGAVLTEDPAIVSHLVTVRDRVWSKAIPFQEYSNRP
ncbi:DUF6879 family protein [Nocardia farcinica]|uniref:DUF6879 family protein n=1 Tax=Nocardia farcinica TaxID=37329 RepID=UPI0024557E5C|nr:DUF6879 family protein [Nocardia farcinica]